MDRITSAKNPAVQRLRALRTAKGRRETGCFLVEGEVMIREAMKCGLRMEEAVADEAHLAFAQELESRGVRVLPVSRGILESVCETQTPQGVCAAFGILDPMPADELPDRIVALDGVQDPGNVGTIWRTADAAGFQALVLGAGSADALSPKVQRAAMGSGFRVPYLQADDLAALLGRMRLRDYHVIASDLHGTCFYERPEMGGKLVLVIGNEARGISPEVFAQADVRLKLPMRGGAESLNAAVAAGIMMYELMK